MSNIIIEILVRRIRNRWVNPKTGAALVVGDILREDYRDAVTERLAG